MTGYEWLILAGLVLATCTAVVLIWMARAPEGEETSTGFRKLNNNNHEGEQ